MTMTYPTQQTDSDTRRAARVDLCRTVKMFEPFSGQTYSAVTANVSAEGLCVHVIGDIDLRPGRFVTLHGTPVMGPRAGGETPRATTARVVWVRPDAADQGVTRVGLQLYARPVAAAA